MMLVRKCEFRNPFYLDSKDYNWMINQYKSVYDRSSLRVAEGIMERGSYRHGIKKRLFISLWNHAKYSESHFTLTKSSGDQVRVAFDARNTQYHALYLERYKYGYEPEVTNFIDIVLSSKGGFCDIGANWGFYSLFVATKPGYSGKVHAFEPLKSSFQDLKSVVEGAGLGDRIDIHEMALSDHRGAGKMVIPDKLNSGLAVLIEEGKGGVTIGLLDELADKPHIIKVDAEGYEPEIISGGLGLISGSRPFIIFESNCNLSGVSQEPTSPSKQLQMYNILEKQGYLFFHPAWFVDDTYIPSNHALFLKGEKLLALKRFDSRERFLHRDKFNCIACHESRLAELTNNFEKR